MSETARLAKKICWNIPDKNICGNLRENTYKSSLK
jgi:hypothetical protein